MTRLKQGLSRISALSKLRINFSTGNLKDMEKPGLNKRLLSYAEAINEALAQAMELSRDVFVMGEIVDYKPGVFGTTKGLADKFGMERVRDFPNAEALMTSTAIGAALAGLRPVIVHARLDFMLYSFDPLANWLALWRFKSDKHSNVPVTIRAIVGKGWGQGPQHSKNLQAWFAHLPGLKVAVPATAHDAKGLLLESIFGESPVVFIEQRALFGMKDEVPKEPYRIRFGRANICRKGKDVTMVAIGLAVPLALKSAEKLSGESISAEVIDVRTIKPLDIQTIRSSVLKTGRLVVVDSAWPCAGMAAEIVASVSESCATFLKSNPVRVTLPDGHTPMSSVLEEEFYLKTSTIEERVRAVLNGVAATVK